MQIINKMKVLILDVDGVMTTGQFLYSESGKQMKVFGPDDNDGLGLGTLYLWAKEDNLEKYKELSEQNLRKCMLDSLSLAPNDIGKVVYHLYKQDFVCSNAKKNTS